MGPRYRSTVQAVPGRDRSCSSRASAPDDKCGVERRSYPPGDHGRGRQKQSEYRVQLRGEAEGQRYYGVLEKQFAIIINKASRQQGVNRREPAAGMLECRLTTSRAPRVRRLPAPGASAIPARPLTVNGRRVNIPSYQLKDRT